MKRIAQIVVTFVLILTSFGFMGTAFMDHSVHEKCPFSILSSSDCEAASNVATSLFHHISATQSLTEAVLVSTSIILLLLILAAAILYLNNFYTPRTNYDLTQYRHLNQEKIADSIPNPILRWISLLNKRSTHPRLLKVVT